MLMSHTVMSYQLSKSLICLFSKGQHLPPIAQHLKPERTNEVSETYNLSEASPSKTPSLRQQKPSHDQPVY